MYEVSALRESKQKNLIIMLAEPTVNHLKMPGRWELTLHVDINLHTHSCQSMLKLKAELVLGWIPGPKSHSSHSSHSSHVCFPPCVGDLQLQNLAVSNKVSWFESSYKRTEEWQWISYISDHNHISQLIQKSIKNWMLYWMIYKQYKCSSFNTTVTVILNLWTMLLLSKCHKGAYSWAISVAVSVPWCIMILEHIGRWLPGHSIGMSLTSLG